MMKYLTGRKFFLFSIAVFVTANSFGQGIVTTIAGDGFADYLGDGSPATNARIGLPAGICADTHGNIYFSQTYNFQYGIRKIDATTGLITTVAGNATTGYSGDGGTATAAQLNMPVGICADASGNIYIADRNNNRIRMVNAATGKISTIAGTATSGFSGDGGPATNAELNAPNDVCLDNAGNIYIADQGNHVVRKITVATGNISTVAGNGTPGNSGNGGAATSASFLSAAWIKTDAANNLYIVDRAAYVIREVNASTSVINQFAGNGTPGSTGDGLPAISASISPQGIAIDASNNVYITTNNTIRKVTASTGIITTIAGNGTNGYLGDGGPATGAEFNGPEDIAIDAASNIYVADYNNNRIRKIHSSLSINPINNPKEFHCYPNPARQQLFLDCTLEQAGMLYAVIMDMEGRELSESTVYNCMQGKNTLNIPLEKLMPGCYILNVRDVRGCTCYTATINKE